MLKKKIFTPGPTQVHPDVLKATISFDTYHRSQDFRAFHTQLNSKLKKIFQTSQYLNILTTSGTGALETAVINLSNEWVKKGVILYFPTTVNKTEKIGPYEFYDKIPLKSDYGYGEQKDLLERLESLC